MSSAPVQSPAFFSLAASLVLALMPVTPAENPDLDEAANPPRERSAAVRDAARDADSAAMRDDARSLADAAQESRFVLTDAALASELRGRDVFNSEGRKLGVISDVVVDLNGERAPYLVVQSGGLLGLARSERVVPTGALVPRPAARKGQQESFAVDVTKSRWRQLPVFDRDRLADLENEANGRNLHHVYAQTWPADVRVADTANPTAPGVNPSDRGRKETPAAAKTKGAVDAMARGQQLVLASDLIGEDLVAGDREIGEIDDVVVALAGGRAALLIDPDDEIAKRDARYVLPFARVIREGGGRYVTDLRRDEFDAVSTADGEATDAAPEALRRWPESNKRIGASSQR